MDIGQIAKRIYCLCYLADKKIAGASHIDASIWGRENSIRHAHTIRAILNYAREKKKKELRILNASGIACGHQDFSVVEYLERNTTLDIDWTVFDSPNNPYLKNELFKRLIRKLNIRLKLSDLKVASNLYGKEKGYFDIVLFTEIAEHLDHSIFLKTVSTIKERLKEEGILIFTTPNLVGLINRLRILFGKGDGPYCGDGIENLSRGLYGHIAIYDILRLKRILEDIGFLIDYNYTFNYGYGPITKYFIKKIILGLVDFISLFFKNSRYGIFIVARKGNRVKIPFRI